MGLAETIGATGAIAKVLVKALELVDPKTRDWVNKRKALEWAESYFLALGKAEVLYEKAKHTTLEKDEQRKLRHFEKKMRWYRKWFWDYQ